MADVKDPQKLVDDIARQQNEEDLGLPKRIGEAVVKGAKAVKDKVNEDLTGGAYVGSRLNMPSNTRMGKVSPSDARLVNEYDASEEGKKAKFERRNAIPSSTKDNRSGMKAGGKVKSASARADGCAIRGKTRA
jgi:hypothetical protein